MQSDEAFRGRKRKSAKEYQKEVKYLREILRRLESKQNALQRQMNKNGIDDTAWKFISTHFSAEINLLLRNEFQNSTRGSHGHRYDERIFSFANTIHYYSPRAYNYLRKMFTLLHTVTMWRMFSSVNCEPGFLNEVFLRLEKDICSKPWLRDCTLMLDAMSIRKGLQYDVKMEKTVGHVDYGNVVENKDTLATEVLVIMIVCATMNFKVPVAYFLTDKVSGLVTHQIVKQIIERLYSIGITIWTITFDGASSNMAAAKEFGFWSSLYLVLIEFSFCYVC